MTDQNYFDVIVKVYNAVGLKRSSPFPLKIISKYVLFPLLLALCGMVVINLKYKSQDVFGVVEVFESVASFGQMLIRKLILILYSSKIEKIINERSLFWSYDYLGGDFSSRLNMKKNQVFTRLKLFWLMCCVAVTLVIVTPIFIEEKSLPSSCWMPTDNKFFFIVVYILQSIFFIELILISPPTDGFFLFVCTDLEIQLQVLSNTLQNVHIGSNQEKCFEKLKQCSVYHRFLLNVHEDLNTVFSIYFVLQFLINIIGTTMQFYILSNTPADVTQVMRCIMYLMTVLFQGSISFLPASNVEIEAEKLANEIYCLDWYNSPNLKIRKFVLFWLMKAQKPVQMSGGGLMTVNRNVFLQIPRTSFSICTLLG